MLPYSGKDLARSFRIVRRNTIQTAHDIPENQWSYRPTPAARSVSELFAHIAAITHVPRALNIVERKTTLGPADFGPYFAASAAYEHSLMSRAAILEALETNGEQFAKDLEALTDADLGELVHFAPPLQPSTKTRFEMLLGVKEHEMHHRGQLMLVQRMVGVIPHLTREREARQQAQTAAR